MKKTDTENAGTETDSAEGAEPLVNLDAATMTPEQFEELKEPRRKSQ